MQELASLNEKVKQHKCDSETARNQIEDLEEKIEKGAERERDLYDTNKRLENHIQDLESRKRAPLYQKKQEEELRAQTEKAQEAEIRAQDAELKFKEAKVRLLQSALSSHDFSFCLFSHNAQQAWYLSLTNFYSTRWYDCVQQRMSSSSICKCSAQHLT